MSVDIHVVSMLKQDFVQGCASWELQGQNLHILHGHCSGAYKVYKQGSELQVPGFHPKTAVMPKLLEKCSTVQGKGCLHRGP